MSNANPPVSQTRSFSTIFLIELWERFGYYGMAALLVLFMIQKIGFDDTKADLVAPALARIDATSAEKRARFVDRWFSADTRARVSALRDQLVKR